MCFCESCACVHTHTHPDLFRIRGLVQTIFGKISVIVTFGGEGLKAMTLQNFTCIVCKFCFINIQSCIKSSCSVDYTSNCGSMSIQNTLFGRIAKDEQHIYKVPTTHICATKQTHNALGGYVKAASYQTIRFHYCNKTMSRLLHHNDHRSPMTLIVSHVH